MSLPSCVGLNRVWGTAHCASARGRLVTPELIVESSALNAVTAYTLLVTTLTQLTLFHPASFARFSSNTTTAHSATSILSCLALGLLLAAIQNGLALAPTSFALLVSRQVVLLLSRTLLTGALYLAYPPSPAPRSGGVWRNLSNEETGSALTGPTQSAGAGGLGAGGTGGRNGAAWNAWEAEKPADQGEVQEGGWLARGLSRKREKSTKSGKTSSGKAARTTQKLVIGAPVTDTFKRLSTGATREFHAHKVGEKLLSDGAVVPGTAAPAPAPVERVVFRTVSDIVGLLESLLIPSHPPARPSCHSPPRSSPPRRSTRSRTFAEASPARPPRSTSRVRLLPLGLALAQVAMSEIGPPRPRGTRLPGLYPVGGGAKWPEVVERRSTSGVYIPRVACRCSRSNLPCGLCRCHLCKLPHARGTVWTTRGPCGNRSMSWSLDRDRGARAMLDRVRLYRSLEVR